MRGREVLSPINRTRNHNILFESSKYWGEAWSIVEAEVTEDGETWEKCLGMRWDGDRNDADSKGFPSSSGKAVWFWLPAELQPFFYGIILPQLTQRKKGESDTRAIQKTLKNILERVSEANA